MRHGMDVLPGPADQESQMPAPLYAGDGFGGGLLKYCQAPGVARICHVDQVMRDAPAFFRCRLGGTDVHAAVEEPRIARDDLATQPFSQLDGNLGLADRAGTDDDDQGRFAPLSHWERERG